MTVEGVTMRIEIIVIYVKRYRWGHEMDFVPPLTGIYLAALTPPNHQVTVRHVQIQSADLDTDADLVAITFFSGFANEAYRLADQLKARGKTVVAGGPHVSFVKEESLKHFDSIVIGEAEIVWKKVLEDLEQDCLKEIYTGGPADLSDSPTPRYDLLPRSFFVQRVVQATRGCPYTCSFCTVPSINPGFRMRPISHVIKDIKYNSFKFWWQRKIVWFWDDNLLANKSYAKQLLRAMAPLKKWWLTQASIEIGKDDELLVLMKQSGCIGVFIGIESFGKGALQDAHKVQNLVHDYASAIENLHKHGIAVMAGIIAGFDTDTADTITGMAKKLFAIGIDVPFISILTPYAGTPLYDRLSSENRIIKERSWNFYNGYNVAFHPKKMSEHDLLRAHRRLWKDAFSFPAIILRIIRRLFRLRLGALLMMMAMNMFYGFKRMTGNIPIDMSTQKPC
jgi:radical SAM superfamily enzyme YgiQ (UPF0313 family)